MLCLSRFFWDIPDMSAHWFQIILNFLYVCQSGGWHTFLLKYDKFRDISNSGWYIFLNFIDTFQGCWYTCSKYFWIPNFKFKHLCTSWIELFTSCPYCLPFGPPSETSGLVIQCTTLNIVNVSHFCTTLWYIFWCTTLLFTLYTLFTRLYKILLYLLY